MAERSKTKKSITCSPYAPTASLGCLAVEAMFPKAIFQTCIVRLIRSSTRYVSYRHLKPICQDL